jgi:hypothetical protein
MLIGCGPFEINIRQIGFDLMIILQTCEFDMGTVSVSHITFILFSNLTVSLYGPPNDRVFTAETLTES